MLGKPFVQKSAPLLSQLTLLAHHPYPALRALKDKFGTKIA
jgi:hypothetical protein